MLTDRARVAVALSLLFMMVGCGGNSRPGKPAYTVGVLVPLTGGAASYGKNASRGAQLALKEFRQSSNSIEPSLKIEDSGGQAAMGTRAALKLLDQDKAVALVCDVTSGVALAVAPIINERSIPTISPGASTPNLAVPGDYFFRTWPSDTLEAGAMANYMAAKHTRNLALLRINNEYGLAMETAFRSAMTQQGLGDVIVLSQSFDQGARDMRTQLLKIKTSKASAIYFIGFPEAAIVMGRGYAETGMTLPVFATSAFEDPQIPASTGAALNGTVFTKPVFSSPRTAAFQAAFQKEFGDAPGLTSDTAYDAMTLLLRALDTVQARDGKITGQAVRSVLEQTKNFAGVSGTISFDENGDVQSDVSFRTLEKGKFQDLPR